MAKGKNQPANATDRPVMLSADSARRVGRMLQAYESGDRAIKSYVTPDAFVDGGEVRLCKTTQVWEKGTLATLNVWESGTPLSETQTAGETIKDVVNKLHYVALDMFVFVAMSGSGEWYLVASAMPSVLSGTFTAPWAKSSTKSVSATLSVSAAMADLTFSVTASNRLAEIGGAGTRKCAIAFDGTTYQLIAAEC